MTIPNLIYKISKTSTLLSISALLTLGANQANADRILGVFVGGHSWQQEFDGFVRELDAVTPTDVDFQDDLGLDDDSDNVFYVALEHPVPFLPNIQLKQSNIQITGSNTLTRTIDIGGETFSATTDVSSEADLSHDDLTLYYQILDNYVSLDLGITARFFDGFVEVDETSGTTSGREEFDAVIPLIYLKARFNLPFTGGYVSVSGNVLGDGDNNFFDYQGIVGWESGFGLGVEAGYRILDLELDDIDDIDAELTVDGAFAGLFFHF